MHKEHKRRLKVWEQTKNGEVTLFMFLLWKQVQALHIRGIKS